MRSDRVRLGTRGSRLSLRQTELVVEALRASHPAVSVEVVVIKTAGDRAPDVPLERLEGIGFFAKELEAALLDGRCDLAMHSAKDLPTAIHRDLALGAYLPRTDPRDVVVDRDGRILTSLPSGARVGTSSVRRAAQILHRRPDLRPASIRGNIDTRLAKLDRGVFDALCIAGAGLLRMGWEARITEWLDPEIMLPAPGQGAIAVELRRGDAGLLELLRPLDHLPTRVAVAAERAFVARLGSGCRAPAAALAAVAGEAVTLEGLIALPNGSRVCRHSASAPIEAAVEVGEEVAEYLLAHAGFALEAEPPGSGTPLTAEAAALRSAGEAPRGPVS